MRNPANWQVYAQGSQPAMLHGERGYTGHEQLNGFGLINMNARLYDPLLARSLAPDPFVGSGLTNDFNRYIYARNNPMMYTDPTGKSFSSWWKKNIAIPFMQELHHVFGNGFTLSFGTDTQFLSTSAVIAPNGSNGMPYGPGFGVQTNDWKTFSPVYANCQGGFMNTQSVNYESNLHQSVVNAEQNARSEYYSLKSMASDYQTQISNWAENHIIFESELRIDYGAQAAGNIKLLGGKLGFDIEKNSTPILQANIDYNNGWKSAIYESGFMNKGEYSYGILDNELRNEWSLNLFGGVDKTYDPTSGFFSWGDIQSKSYNLLFYSDTYLYDHNQNCYETQHTIDFGFNFALGLGINANIKFGYK